MKFVTVRDLRSAPADVWSTLERDGEVVITNHGKPMALLTSLSDETLEETVKAVRSARALLALNEIQRQSVANGTHLITEDEINAEIADARRTIPTAI